MADLSGMKLKKLPKTDWDNYPVGGEALPPNLPGIYTARVGKATFEARDGFLMATVDLTIEDGEAGKDTSLRDWLMTKPRDKGKRAGTSKAGDFLKAVGSDANPGEDQQEWADAIEATEGAIVQVKTDWNCYDSEKQVELAGSYDQFPLIDNADATKGRQAFITVGEKRYRARQRPVFYITPRG